MKSSPSDVILTPSAPSETASELIARILRTPVVIPGNKEADLIERARASSPEEACGYALVRDNHLTYIRELSNLAMDSTKEFVLDPWTLSDVLHWWGHGQVLIWHTHPTAWVFPSRLDVELMRTLRLRHVIVGLKGRPEVAVYGLKGDRVIRLRPTLAVKSKEFIPKEFIPLDEP